MSSDNYASVPRRSFADDSGSDIDESYNIAHIPNEFDRDILENVDEEETLLGRLRESLPGTKTYARKEGPAKGKRQRNERQAPTTTRDAGEDGSSIPLYERRRAYQDSNPRISIDSQNPLNEKWSQSPKSSTLRFILMGAGLGALLLLLFYGSYSASRQGRSPRTMSNGTHVFRPTTILISLDGFRADFLHRGLTPTMTALVESGVSPKYMLPSFPSLTFPNHFTLVTGLYPESHGIVSNQFWDPDLGEEFYYTNISSSMRPKWWNAEPIWVTAENAGLKTAIHMWPGSEAHIGNIEPTYLDKYDGNEALGVKVARILHWLDMPIERRPQFIGAYVPNVDSDGHKYGPNSTEIRATIVEVDSMLTDLIDGLFQRNLTEVVNLVIVSDHGMATTSNDRLIQLDDFVDMSLVDHIDGWPLRGLRLKNPVRDVPVLYEKLLTASHTNRFDVYTRETMPKRYHFESNDRIAPLWVIPQTGWAIVEKKDFDIGSAKLSGQQYEPIGLHGYDHEHPLMRAIFIARGPAFPHRPNSRISTFQNIEVYNVLCDSLGIQPHSNNGTLRLPFATEGLHSDFDDADETPVDPVDSLSQDSSPPAAATTVSTTSHVIQPATTVLRVSKTGDSSTANFKPAATDEAHRPPAGAAHKHSSWWDFLHNQINKVKGWAKEFVDSIRNNKSPSDQSVE